MKLGYSRDLLKLLAAFAVAQLNAADAPISTHPDGLPEGLTGFNLPAGCEVRMDSLRVVALKGTDHFIHPDHSVSIMSSPRYVFEVAGDFTLVCRVDSQFSKPYDGASLLIEADGLRWAKLLFERMDTGVNGLGTLVTLGVSDDAHHGELPQDHCYLKVERTGAVVRFSSSGDGRTWTFLRMFRLEAAGPLKVAFAAQSPSSESVVATFSEFHLTETTALK